MRVYNGANGPAPEGRAPARRRAEEGRGAEEEVIAASTNLAVLCNSRHNSGVVFSPRGFARADKTKLACRARRRTPRRDRSPQPPLLRRGRARHLRPRVRPPPPGTHRTRSQASRTRHARQPDPARRRGAPIEGFRKVTHKVPMLSIENSYDEADLRKFDADVRKALPGGATVEYVVELKIDGVSMSITYENGRLAVGATRGSGRRRRRRDPQPQTIAAIPLKLKTKNPPAVFEVRGEVYMTRSRTGAHQRRAGEEQGRAVQERPQLHRRHAQAARPEGSRQAQDELLRLRHRGDRRRRLSARRPSCSNTLKEFGFPVNPHTKLCQTMDEVIAYCREWDKKRHDLPYDTDGMVIKVNDFAQRERLGFTAKVPRWAKAYKFEAEQATTKLGAVEFSLGKFGELTPVAKFDPPVQLAGTTVTYASMHNASWVAEKDVRIGDTVVVEKKGEIIPQVVDVVTRGPHRQGEGHPVAEDLPEVRRAGREGGDGDQLQLRLRATPALCPAQVAKRIEGYARRTRMDIDGLGRGGRHSTGRFRAGEVDPRSLPADQEAAAHAREVRRPEGAEPARRHRPKQGPRPRAAAAGAVHLHGRREHGRGAGRGVPVARRHRRGQSGGPRSREGVRARSGRSSSATTSTAPPARSSSPSSRAWASRRRTRRRRAPAGGLPLAGKTVVVTGTLENYDRVGIENADQGRRRQGDRAACSKKTDYVLVGDKPGSKYDKAKELGVKILTEDEFRKLIGK